MGCLKVFFFFIITLLLFFNSPYVQSYEVILADFEDKIPCSDCGDIIGFRKKDKMAAEIVPGGAEGSRGSMAVMFSSKKKDLFFQGKVRRMYMATQSTYYDTDGPNAFSFWIKLPKESPLLGEKNKRNFGVWTYHWRLGDTAVGGKTNYGLATDSMMHGYAFFGLTEDVGGKWARVLLSPSAFKISRYYYHFYSAEGTTDNLKFFPSLRQLQFHVDAESKEKETFQLDQLKLVHLPPTANFVEDFFRGTASKRAGDIRVPVSISNPTDRARKYRVFISSCIGVSREVLHGAFALVDDFSIPRKMQAEAGGDGGIGVVELVDENDEFVIAQRREIFIPAGGTWEGTLVHHIRPEMLGPPQHIKINGRKFPFRRDTLTTSVIVWDPYDESIGEMAYVKPLPSNADDGNHAAPPGFPRQKRLPKGWRSEDIFLNQVGGYFVSVIKLTEN